jgi:hypothetical protein
MPAPGKGLRRAVDGRPGNECRFAAGKWSKKGNFPIFPDRMAALDIDGIA